MQNNYRENLALEHTLLDPKLKISVDERVKDIQNKSLKQSALSYFSDVVKIIFNVFSEDQKDSVKTEAVKWQQRVKEADIQQFVEKFKRYQKEIQIGVDVIRIAFVDHLSSTIHDFFCRFMSTKPPTQDKKEKKE